MVTWSGLTPFSGQLDAWLRSKPAAGPPLSVVNTIIESWWSTFAFFLNEVTVVVMRILMNSCMMSKHSFDLEHVGALESFNDFANTLVELVKHPGELTTVQVLRGKTCTSERVHYCSLKWTYASVYPHWYQFLVSYLDVAVSLDCIFRGLYNVQMLISHLVFSVSFLAWPSTSAMENEKQNSTIYICWLVYHCFFWWGFFTCKGE